MREARRAALTVALALLPGILSAGDVELFPNATVQLEGAYYIPPEEAFVWDTWIGAGAGLLRVRTATAYVTADVETVLGRERRAFDANQVNYHLEGGLRIRRASYLVIPFFHHVSRHVVDRPKNQLVDWNLLGARVAGQWPETFPLRGRYAASVAHTVEWRTVGYEWELIGALDVDLYRRSWGALYLRAGTRFVTVSPETGIPRGNFADVLAETGARLGKDARELDLFVAYQHRNDVLLFEPGARDRALLGLRIGLAPDGGVGSDLPSHWLGGSLR